MPSAPPAAATDEAGRRTALTKAGRHWPKRQSTRPSHLSAPTRSRCVSRSKPVRLVPSGARRRPGSPPGYTVRGHAQIATPWGGTARGAQRWWRPRVRPDRGRAAPAETMDASLPLVTKVSAIGMLRPKRAKKRKKMAPPTTEYHDGEMPRRERAAGERRTPPRSANSHNLTARFRCNSETAERSESHLSRVRVSWSE